ncbi:PTS sugar transporter subunit IIB [Lactobacillus sp. M0390]|jgi:Phosphotransferase system, mannose/fructose/N-acetylgalactosamine-specific component IIB|uniref:PTS sugar transporter subunit IIB n=1 Tax=Lactobacillus sp. M0390 TaxID=2751026 RepID=UPI0018DB5AEB|nr:PTS sugar transporter subunit IIB [Lactobacillus sp. M0390]MBH9985944.1 PTS sugar transporter subunit IIB [Lactobacillus sp. M0390]MCT6889234.1 PTS sugar transporter subunit IIB [Lactobacillus sp.]
MIKMMRVDHRLLHGQVAFSWTSALSADCILIADDETASNELKKSAMKLAKPNGVKLVIKNVDEAIKSLKKGVTDKYKLFIVVGSIESAKKIIDGYPEIKTLNLGGTLPGPNKSNISKTIAITSSERDMLRDLLNEGVDINIQMVPSDSKVNVKNII